MNNKKKLMIPVIILLIIAVIGVTYSFFNYTRTGLANTVRVGRIYFNHQEGDTINLSNVFPITSEQAQTDTVNAKTLSITVTGDTDYDKGIEYLVSLTDVKNTVNGKKIPINLEVSVTGDGLGTEETGNYYTNRESYTISKYKKEFSGTIKEDGHILVGYIAPNTTKGTIEGINDIINIKAYVNIDNVLISDTIENGPIVEEGYTNGTNTNGKTVFTTEEWNSLTGSNALSFKVKVEANEGIWVSNKPVNNCTFDISTVNVTTYDINKEECIAAVQANGFSHADADGLCSGETIDYLGTEVDFEAGLSALGMTLEFAEQQGVISNLQTGPATELVKGIEYVNGQYTYSYTNNGWTMRLTDKNSTDPVTTKMCTTVNGYPITSMQATFMRSNATSIDLSSFDTSNVTDMSGMFTSSSFTSLDLSSINTSNVIKMQNMFEGSKATSIDLSSFDTNNVTNMSCMFCNSQATSLDLSSFDTSNVTNMNAMFYSSRAVTIYVSNLWNTNSVTNSDSMFDEAEVIGPNGTNPKIYYDNGTSYQNPTDVTYARVDNAPTEPGYFTYKEAPVRDNNNDNNNNNNDPVPEEGTIDSCTNCKFIYSTTTMYTTWNTVGQTPTVITTGYSKNYNDVVAISGKNYFLGVVTNGSNQITNVYACGLYNGTTPFCIEGTSDGSKYSSNSSLINGSNLWNNTCTSEMSKAGWNTSCGPWNDSSVSAVADSNDNVRIGVSDGYGCLASSSGEVGCSEYDGD